MAGVAGVQVWFAPIDAGQLPDGVRASFAAELDEATVARLGRFRRAEDRDRGLTAHALLRRLLGSLLGLPPRALSFGLFCRTCGGTDHGKPFLQGFGDSPPVRFNLSHSGGLVAVALAPPQFEIGMDVESRSRRVDWTALRGSVFADTEWDRSAQAPDPARARTDLWSRKEAAAKATGHGLAASMRSVLISAGHGVSWEASVEMAGAQVRGWDVAAAGGFDTGYAAAVAVTAAGDMAAAGADMATEPTQEPQVYRAEW